MQSMGRQWLFSVACLAFAATLVVAAQDASDDFIDGYHASAHRLIPVEVWEMIDRACANEDERLAASAVRERTLGRLHILAAAVLQFYLPPEYLDSLGVPFGTIPAGQRRLEDLRRMESAVRGAQLQILQRLAEELRESFAEGESLAANVYRSALIHFISEPDYWWIATIERFRAVAPPSPGTYVDVQQFASTHPFAPHERALVKPILDDWGTKALPLLSGIAKVNAELPLHNVRFRDLLGHQDITLQEIDQWIDAKSALQHQHEQLATVNRRALADMLTVLHGPSLEECALAILRELDDGELRPLLTAWQRFTAEQTEKEAAVRLEGRVMARAVLKVLHTIEAMVPARIDPARLRSHIRADIAQFRMLRFGSADPLDEPTADRPSRSVSPWSDTVGEVLATVLRDASVELRTAEVDSDRSSGPPEELVQAQQEFDPYASIRLPERDVLQKALAEVSLAADVRASIEQMYRGAFRAVQANVRQAIERSEAARQEGLAWLNAGNKLPYGEYPPGFSTHAAELQRASESAARAWSDIGHTLANALPEDQRSAFLRGWFRQRLSHWLSFYGNPRGFRLLIDLRQVCDALVEIGAAPTTFAQALAEHEITLFALLESCEMRQIEIAETHRVRDDEGAGARDAAAQMRKRFHAEVLTLLSMIIEQMQTGIHAIRNSLPEHIQPEYNEILVRQMIDDAYLERTVATEIGRALLDCPEFSERFGEAVEAALQAERTERLDRTLWLVDEMFRYQHQTFRWFQDHGGSPADRKQRDTAMNSFLDRHGSLEYNLQRRFADQLASIPGLREALDDAGLAFVHSILRTGPFGTRH